MNITRYVAESAELREAAISAKTKIEAEFVDLEMRKEIYNNLVKYRDEFSNKDNLSEEQKKCLDRLILNGRRNGSISIINCQQVAVKPLMYFCIIPGLQLDEETCERVKELKKNIINLSLDFTKNLADDSTIVLLDAAELEGLSEEFVKSLDKVE